MTKRDLSTLRTMRRRAWRAAERAETLLREYATQSETRDYFGPDADDALWVADHIRQAQHRIDDHKQASKGGAL